tara:strand:+ start:335 stop:619 length:285 start_codon:yes stop_codon:yes gene_type:complete
MSSNISNMNYVIEQVCANAIAVVERYIDSGVVEDDSMYDEICEAQKAVDHAWDVCKSRKSQRICRAAWTACLSAKTDHISSAKMNVDEYKELVK